MGSTLQRKWARFPCFRREDSRKYLNEKIFARDGSAPRCLHGLLFIQQKVNILENGSIRCGLLFFTLKTAALKFNNSDDCEWNTTIIITQCQSYKRGLWNYATTRRKRHISRTALDQSALKKLTEEPLRTKIVRRRKKVLAGKERASIRALYLNLRVIYFSNLSNVSR